MNGDSSAPRPHSDAKEDGRFSASRADFTATHWTEVALAAQQDGSIPARQALEALCVRYWPAIYSFLRRKGHAPSDAEDLTQGFFIHLLQQNALTRASKNKGRFRSFLLGALHRFLVDDFRHKGAAKRGRDRVVLAMDFLAVEERYLEETDPSWTPQEAYDRRWAATVIECAYKELRCEFERAGQAARFELLKRFLSEDAQDGEYGAVGVKLGVGVKAISSAVSRLRHRYRELVRSNVLSTVGSPQEIDPEFQDLFK